MSHRRFRVNSQSIVAWMSRNSLIWHLIWRTSDCNGIQTHNDLVCKRTLNHSTKQTKWLSWVVSAYLCGNWHDRNTQLNAPFRQVLTTQLNHMASLAEWFNVRLRTKCLCVWVPLQSLNLQVSRLFRSRSSLTFRQL